MTWRSIESDPPEYHAFVWLANAELKREQPVEFITLGVTKLGWTHWSPCEPPADLPPAPKTAFEEWCEKTQRPESMSSGTADITINGKRRCVTIESAEIIFNAGYEAGKAKG
jgi:hypothetical protein